MIKLDDVMKAIEKYSWKNNSDYNRVVHMKFFTDASDFWIDLAEVTDADNDRHWVVFEGVGTTVSEHYKFEYRSDKAYDCFLSEINECL